MESIHYTKILKRVVDHLWDTLPNRERHIIANDASNETDLSKWFSSTAAQMTKAKYESPTYWMNDEFSFRYPQGD